jgi:FtsH-binding integral membrane protein
MSVNIDYRRRNIGYGGATLLIAAMTTANLLIKSPPDLSGYLCVAVPLVCLFLLWYNFRSVNEASHDLFSRVSGESKTQFLVLQRAIEKQMIFGICGIAASVMAGYGYHIGLKWLH